MLYVGLNRSGVCDQFGQWAFFRDARVGNLGVFFTF